MSDVVISIENVSKKYRIAHRTDGASYKTMRDTIAEKAKGLFKGFRGQRDLSAGPNSVNGNGNSAHLRAVPAVEDFWALRAISFEVKRGQVLGIIGRNGAGKSTLLKILSRITEPTEGRIRIRGRVASLLEVGTGFHPELTGRENIFLNGAILGMSRVEIKSKFDAIVDFAGIEKFLDTPVKRYSSGMYVRLAFAVAAHLEPEILIIDEVLAVGDADFQRKCLGKMQSVAQEGRTILFVSHNLGILQNFCQNGVLLEKGQVVAVGDVQTTVSQYLARSRNLMDTKICDRVDRRGSGLSRITGLRIESASGAPQLRTGGAARFEFEISRLLPAMTCCFTVYNRHGQALAHFNTAHGSQRDITSADRGTRYVCNVALLMLVPGTYWVNVALNSEGETVDHVESAASFNVEAGAVAGRLYRERFADCDISMEHEWLLPPPNCDN